MICPKGYKHCKCETFSNWLPDGTSFKEFIRPRELWALIVIMVGSIIFFGWWGLLVGYIVHTSLLAYGGLTTILPGDYPPREQVIKYKNCSKGKCNLCAVIK